jgi:AcrR family transcriptional regulator
MRKTIVSAAKAHYKNGAWQAQKSQLTRLRILQATVRCLVKVGYAETLTETIAKEAEVSRGAMMHHFKSRAEVFCAAAKFIVEQR